MLRSRVTLLVFAGLVLAWFLACSGSSPSGGGNGSMNVHLVDGPVAGFLEINVNIQSVEISGDGGWVPLGTPNKTINLLSLVGGVDETLVAGKTLAPGHYGQMRLILGSGSTVKLADGSVHDLTVPSGLQTGIKLVVNFDVAQGTTKDVWIDFDAAHSIQVVQAGASGQYLLRPTIWAYDKLVTGSIHGILADAATSTGLPGVAVYAETLDPSGNAWVVAHVDTDATGAYTLVLPVGSIYYVVAQPVTGATTPKAYDAKASDAFVLSAANPVFTYNAVFTADPATGGVGGGLTPMATSSQSDWVNLLQSLATPTSGSHAFVVQSTMAVLGAAAETYGFLAVPVGAYRVQAVRTTLNPDGSSTQSSSAVQPAVVAAGATASVNLGY